MVWRSDPEKHKAQIRSANRARYRAEQLLIEEHRARFDQIYAACAAAEGVTPQPKPSDPRLLKAEITRLRKKLAQLESSEADGE